MLLRIVDTSSPKHASAVSAVRIIGEQHRIVIVPQVAYEFWAVATRTVDANGLGMNVTQADQHLSDIVNEFPMLRDERGIAQHWWELVRKHAVTGVKSHDARIVAAMQRHGITQLLTFSARDFSIYSSIVVLTPESILSAT